MNSDPSYTLTSINNLNESNQTIFGQLATAEINPIIQESFPYNINPRKYTTTLVSNGIVDTNNSKLRLQTSSTINSSAEIISKKTIIYRAGQGVMVLFTACWNASPSVNSESAIGIGSPTDGFFFGYDGTNFGILHRNSSSGSLVNTWIPQTTWNKDFGDGTQILPILNKTKGNVFKIEFQYLGFGLIKFSIENSSTGKFILVHQIEYANQNTNPSLKNSSLHFFAKIQNGATAQNDTLESASFGFFVQGKSSLKNLITFATDNTKSSIGSTETNILTIKNKSIVHTGAFNNHNLTYILFLSVATIGFTKPVTIFIKKNVTLGGTPSYTDVSLEESFSSFDIAGTTVSNGELVASFVMSKEDSIQINLSIFNIFLEGDDNEILTISGSTISGSGEIYTSISWRE